MLHHDQWIPWPHAIPARSMEWAFYTAKVPPEPVVHARPCQHAIVYGVQEHTWGLVLFPDYFLPSFSKGTEDGLGAICIFPGRHQSDCRQININEKVTCSHMHVHCRVLCSVMNVPLLGFSVEPLCLQRVIDDVGT